MPSFFFPSEWVLTRFGYGTVEATTESSLEVRLHEPFAGSDRLSGSSAEVVFPLNYALVRIVNVRGLYLTNTSFLAAREFEIIEDIAYPQDEMRILLDLDTRKFNQNMPFGIGVEARHVLLQSWVDRWGKTGDDIQLDDDRIESAVVRHRDSMHSTSCGIAFHCVLDREQKKVVWHEFLCESGWVAHPTTPTL